MQFAIQSLSNVDSLRVKASPKEFHLSLSPAVIIPCLPATDTMSPRPRAPATSTVLYILSR